MIFFNKLCRTSKCQDIYKKKKGYTHSRHSRPLTLINIQE